MAAASVCLLSAGVGSLNDTIRGQESVTEPVSDFEAAVRIIKKYETLHQPRHWPLVGYGHQILRGEKFSRTRALPESEADALLRKDLLKNCAFFREFGADSLLLGVLAYNIGSGTVSRSSIVKKLRNGDRDIRDIYVAYNKYRGKPHNGLRNRRIEEFETLYKATLEPETANIDSVPASATPTVNNPRHDSLPASAAKK